MGQFPEMNATVDEADLVVHHRYDIGVAVGTEGGLMVPVVRDADRYSLADLIDVVADLAARALERKLTPDEMGGQTFTISNIGPVGADHATQIIPAGYQMYQFRIRSKFFQNFIIINFIYGYMNQMIEYIRANVL